MNVLGRGKNQLVRWVGRFARVPVVSLGTRGFFQRHINIVYYHGVWARGAPQLRLFTGTSVDQLASDLRMMMRFFNVVSLSDVLHAPGSEPNGKPTLAVTFDDGFDLIGSGAAAVLEEMKISATAFVISACVHYRSLMWQHRFYAIRGMRGDEVYLRELNRMLERTGIPRIRSAGEQDRVTRAWPASRKDEYALAVWEACDMPPIDAFLAEHRPYFDWGGLKDWVARGHSVGFHTYSHPFCSRLQPGEVESEVVGPAAEVRLQCGLDWLPFAYPFGDRLPPAVEAEVAARGVFSCLLGTGRLSCRPSSLNATDRVSAEGGVDEELFGRPLARAFTRAIFS